MINDYKIILIARPLTMFATVKRNLLCRQTGGYVDLQFIF